jgi:hypothetical protein
VTVIVAVLTGAAYFFATQKLEANIRQDTEAKASRAEDMLVRVASLEAFDIITRARTFAREAALQKALDSQDRGARQNLARQAIDAFAGKGEGKADWIAVLDNKGEVIAANSPLPDTEGWRTRFKSVADAIAKRQPSKDVWSYGKSAIKVGVAPVEDPSFLTVKGVVVLAYALSQKEAQANAALLGTEVVYLYGDRVEATSFRRPSDADELSRADGLKALAKETLAGKERKIVQLEVEGTMYLASAAPLPQNYEDRSSVAVVMASLSGDEDAIASVKWTILLLGMGALFTALLAMLVTTRSILHPAEDIELGVNEIINGNVDYTFRPAGADFDGLANALNVMLARLLGRPEPGEDDLAGDGETQSAKLLLEEEKTGPRVSSDPDVVALAQESEADYYQRIFDEYIEARKGVGEKVEGVTFDGFVAKLRLNEANLKKKYNCKAVRFRVQTKGNQVTLKPVPIV